MNKQSTVSAKEIQSIVNTPTAETIMLALSLRERDREVTDLRRFRNTLVKDGTRINPTEYYQFFRDLETKGAGRLKVGKRGTPSRFVWNTSMKQVGTYGISGSPQLRAIVKPKLAVVKTPKIEKTVAFFSSRGTTVRVELPGEVSEQQLTELAAMFAQL